MAMLEPIAASASQPAMLRASKATPTPTAACTNSKARSTTPAWQTSNTEPDRRTDAPASR
jgi:hypothetical protein